MTYLGKYNVIDYTDKIMSFIEKNELENEYGNLIIDYIEKLFLNGYPVLDTDIEAEVYNFYNYLSLYIYILTNEGEESFIEKIVSEELNKKVK